VPGTPRMPSVPKSSLGMKGSRSIPRNCEIKKV
jgi:hypothetical protein